MKKPLVLGILFILPLVIYLFFASGVNRFGRLPVLTEALSWKASDSDTLLSSANFFEGNISTVVFLGSEVEAYKGFLFNFNQKIYKRFYQFTDFQTVVFVTPDQAESVATLLSELGEITDTSRYRFVYLESKLIFDLFSALRADQTLSGSAASPYVFIIDKSAALRGRSDDEDKGTLYGYDMRSVAELNNKMEDDVKVLLAEYRLALKKNYADRK